MMNEYVDIVGEIDKVNKSYMTKQELIDLITSLEFIAVESATINFITGYNVIEKDNVKRIGYSISIN